MNRIINMILRQITRRLVTKGIDAGFGVVSRRADTPPEGQQTQSEIRAARRARRQGKQKTAQARQAMKALRRVTRF